MRKAAFLRCFLTINLVSSGYEYEETKKIGMKNLLLPFRYLPLFFVAGSVILYLDEGVGFARAVDVGLGSLFTSTTGASLLIACIFSWIYYFYDRRKQKSSPQPVPQQQGAEPDTKFYEQALAELDSEEKDSGIWL